MKITWLGHACFLVEDSKGKKVIIDPFQIDPQLFANRGLKFDYPPISGVQADVVLISHEHFDHNAAEAVEGLPAIIREPGNFKPADIPVLAVPGEHDSDGGQVRGSNLLLRWEMDGISLCHCGDFGQKDLSPEQVEALGQVDILFVPVGGDPIKGPTVDAKGAKKLVDVLNPHLVIPMHYSTPAVNFLQPVDNFLRLMNKVEEMKSSGLEISPEQVLSLSTTVFVFQTPTA